MVYIYPGTQVDLGYGRGWLDADAAASIRRIDAALGHPLQITEAGRSFFTQEQHWLKYLRDGWPIALNPNTPSEHQKGKAIDSNEAQRNQSLMEEHGWRRTVYRWVNGKWTLVEPWHYEYFINLDRHRNEAPASGGNTTPIKSDEEDNPMLMLIIEAGPNKHRAALGEKVFRHFIKSDPYERIMKISRSADDWQTIDISELPAFLRTYGCDLNIWDTRDPQTGKSVPSTTPGAQFVVLDPLDGSVKAGNVWTAENATRREIADLRKAIGK